MGFKTGVLVGLGVGYVLGARAGRERYEDIERLWNRVSGAPQVQKVAGRTREVAGEGMRRGLHAVQQGADKARSAVMDRMESAGGDQPATTDPSVDPWRGSTVPDTPEGNLP